MFLSFAESSARDDLIIALRRMCTVPASGSAMLLLLGIAYLASAYGIGATEHPDTERVRQLLGKVGLNLPVERGSRPALIADIKSPRGCVELR